MKAAPAALGVVGEKRADLPAQIVPALRSRCRRLSRAGSTEPIEALGRLGPEARNALPELEKLKGAENESMRKAAAEAIGKIAK